MRWDDVKMFSVTINPNCLFLVNQRRHYEKENTPKHESDITIFVQ